MIIYGGIPIAIRFARVFLLCSASLRAWTNALCSNLFICARNRRWLSRSSSCSMDNNNSLGFCTRSNVKSIQSGTFVRARSRWGVGELAAIQSIVEDNIESQRGRTMGITMPKLKLQLATNAAWLMTGVIIDKKSARRKQKTIIPEQTLFPRPAFKSICFSFLFWHLRKI